MDDGDIQGPAGSTVRLSIARPGDEPYDVVLVRQEVQGRVSPQPRRFPGDIGYVAIPTLWVSDMDEQVSGALTELVAEGELNGLIIDLRGNGGGWGHVLSGILGHFVRGPVGKFLDQRNARVLNVTAPAGPDVRPVPLMVLVDHNTASYAEVLAAILQYEAKAQIIGTPSAGNTESIYAYYLRDGSRLWLAQESFLLQSGVNLEGDGVQPDVLLDVDWKRYSEEDDPQILEALRLLGAGPK
jgi:C-terminal processing protease CtpA/Prc